jgi:DNA-binding NarL/FixJ family response regulator
MSNQISPDEKHVLIVDDLASARAWLQRAVEAAYTGAVISTAACLDGGLQAAMQSADKLPDLALIDLGLPDGNGLEIVKLLNSRSPNTVCIVSTLFDDDAHLFPALRAGARGYVLKDETLERLIELLQGIEAGQPPLSASIARRVLMHFANPSGANHAVAHSRTANSQQETPHEALRLTERESDTLKLIAKGLNVPRIAELLGLSKHTVAGYVRDVYRKLSINSRAEATLIAAQRGMLGVH